ncbi:RidA family protein [Pseudomonas sp. FP2196]|uniref:RidA family protein n=1 Tax=Pseudomonas sp. FP2196 TaxID=2954086 RepID=UPI002735ACF5|nr:RidA family protein [Pseudomonas sp. FP2196]WLH37825.1 RidA family protein [Pseudomonas sp. FP2196]
MSVREKLKALDLRLPEAPVPQGDYVPVVVYNGVAYVSGQVCRLAASVITGPARVGTSDEILALAARTCVLRALSALEQAVGDLNNVERILFVRGFVYAEDGYQNYSKILDEASRLLVDVFGEHGRHARSALGVAGLPSNGLLEMELVVAVR